MRPLGGMGPEVAQQTRSAHPDAEWVRADVRALPFAGALDLAVSFGALGHFLPVEHR